MHMQVALHDAEVRKGTLLLKAHSLQLLGGQVERLEQARQRLVADWAQPAGAQAVACRHGT